METTTPEWVELLIINESIINAPTRPADQNRLTGKKPIEL